MSLISDRGFSKLYELSGAVSSTITMEVDWAFAHAFAGVDFFSDVALQNPVNASAGTVTITGQTIVTETFQTIQNGDILANAPSVVSFGSNTLKVRATPSGVVGAAYYRLRVSTNRS